MHDPAQVPATVSVIIPTYNRLGVLQRALESVRQQSYAPHEVIVVDDGSTDGTGEWLKTNGKPDIIISQSNHGVSHARNRAIERATGFWIALLDSDDFWYKDKLWLQMNALINNTQFRLCHCDEHWIRNDKRVNQKLKHKKHGGHIFEHCLPLCAMSPSATVMQKNMFNQYGLFDESLPACEDYDMWLRISCNEPVLYIDKPLLAKTGGHADQLSQRYPAMDRFRIAALAKLIRTSQLSTEYRALAEQTFMDKSRIYYQGAVKRGKTDIARQFLEQYADILGGHPSP